MLSTNRHGCYSASYRHAESAWLEQPPDEWEANDSYQSLKALGKSITVTNDVTKRDRGMLKSFSQSIRDPAQLQWLHHAVEHAMDPDADSEQGCSAGCVVFRLLH